MEERSEELWHEKARQLGIVVIIPTYNNEKTLTTVIEDVLFYVEDIIVVNDGSTDSTPTLLENYPNLHIITHPTNKGKGTALKNGLKQAKAAGYRYAITIDSDGQHFASDIPIFMEEIEKEMQAIAETGLEEILILTGESEKMSSVEYIGEACKIAKKYFRMVGLEIYPVNSDQYTYLHQCGVDYVTVFQETYNSDKYETLHLAGNKRIWPYRFNTQERALMGGMRGVGFAALLGLDDFRKDAFACGYHAYLLQRKYPKAEIAMSCPRLRPIINNDKINPKDVHEPQLLQVICAYRLLLPFASITISTRECERFRNNVIKIVATKISAGVNVGIGGHTGEEKGDEQFEISDGRSVEEVFNAIKEQGLQPVMSDYIYV